MLVVVINIVVHISKLKTHFTMKILSFFLLFQRHANNLLQLDNGVKVPPRLVVIYGVNNLLADCLANSMAAFFLMEQLVYSYFHLRCLINRGV